jgi:hypothetical protein
MIDIFINFDYKKAEYTCSYIIDDIVTTCSEGDLFNCLWAVLQDLRKNKNTNRLYHTRQDIRLLRYFDESNYVYEYDWGTLVEYVF